MEGAFLEGIWRDLLVTSLLLNAFLTTLVLWFRSTMMRDIHDLRVSHDKAEQRRAEKTELQALADRVAFISRDYASREDIERISAKLDTLYTLLVSHYRGRGSDE